MSKTIISKVIGELTQDEKFEDWWLKADFSIPFFDGQSLPITFMDFNPDADPDFIKEADQALQFFLSKGRDERMEISEFVYQNLDLIRQEVDYPYWSSELRKLSEPAKVWHFVRPMGISLARRPYGEQDMYVDISCSCEWEEEHGLQLVYRQGRKLTRVSQIDGHLTDADAYDMPDEQDKLFSQF